MSEIFFQVEEASEGGYTARASENAIFTEADTIEELGEMVKEAVTCHFEEEERPARIRLHLVKEEVVSV